MMIMEVPNAQTQGLRNICGIGKSAEQRPGLGEGFVLALI